MRKERGGGWRREKGGRGGSKDTEVRENKPKEDETNQRRWQRAKVKEVER